ncbi:MAG: alpha/beta hydrolase [Acidobacteriota bacterium]
MKRLRPAGRGGVCPRLAVSPILAVVLAGSLSASSPGPAAGPEPDGDGTPEWAETELTLEVSGVRIPARLTLPRRDGTPASAMVLVPGSLHSDVDGNYPSWGIFPRTYADLGRQLAARGHAVLRFAKLGPGSGSEVVDAAAAERHRAFLHRVDTARAALDLLLASPSLKGFQGPAVVAGHSEGAVVAFLLAQRDRRIRGVVSLSGPSVGLLDILREQAAAMPGVDGPGALEILDATLRAIRDGAQLPPEAADDPAARGVASMDEASHRYLAEVDGVDPAAELARVHQPVLLIQGGRDPSVLPHHMQRLATARAGKPTKTALFPDLQHMYKTVEGELDPMASFALATDSDPAVAAAIDGWIRHSVE